MKYASPKYKIEVLEASDVITASLNCSVERNVTGSFNTENGEPTSVTRVSGFFSSISRD